MVFRSRRDLSLVTPYQTNGFTGVLVYTGPVGFGNNSIFDNGLADEYYYGFQIYVEVPKPRGAPAAVHLMHSNYCADPGVNQ